MNKQLPSWINTHHNGGVENRPVSQGEFPSARYFQTHFEFIGETLEAITRDLAALTARLDALEQKINDPTGDSQSLTRRLKSYRDS